MDDVLCAECEHELDVLAIGDDAAEYDIISVQYRSGETEKLRMIFHKRCNIARIEENNQLEIEQLELAEKTEAESRMDKYFL